MGQPSQADVHVNVPLTQISLAYRQDATRFIADQVFPRIPVMHQSDIYWEFERDAFFRTDVEKRAGGARSSGTGFKLLQSGPYYSDVYSVHADITKQMRQNADPGTNLDFAFTELVTQQSLIKRDNTFLTNFFGTSLWTGIDGTNGDMTGVTATPTSNQFLRWDQSGSTPREDVRGKALAIEGLTGLLPNTLVLGPYVMNSLINNPELIDAVKYTSGGIIGPEDLPLLAKFFGVDRVLRAGAVQNTATEGATRSMGFIFGKAALLCYSAPNPGLMVPSAGYTFAWQSYLGGSSDIEIAKWWEQNEKVDRVEAEMTYDMKQTGTDLGIFFTTCVS
jgi:hypothetical protein